MTAVIKDVVSVVREDNAQRGVRGVLNLHSTALGRGNLILTTGGQQKEVETALRWSDVRSCGPLFSFTMLGAAVRAAVATACVATLCLAFNFSAAARCLQAVWTLNIVILSPHLPGLEC